MDTNEEGGDYEQLSDSDMEEEKDDMIVVGGVAYMHEKDEMDEEEEKDEPHHTVQSHVQAKPLLTDLSGKDEITLAVNKNCCWWDCHPFDTIPFVLPKRFEQRRKKYLVYGNFCSPNCAKSYLYHENQGKN